MKARQVAAPHPAFEWSKLALRRTLPWPLLVFGATVLTFLARANWGTGSQAGALERQAVWIGALALLALPLLLRSSSSFGRARKRELDALIHRPASRWSLVVGEFGGIALGAAVLFAAIAISAEWSAGQRLAWRSAGSLRLARETGVSPSAHHATVDAPPSLRLLLTSDHSRSPRAGDELRVEFASFPGAASLAEEREIHIALLRGETRTPPQSCAPFGRSRVHLPVPSGSGPLRVEIQASAETLTLFTPLSEVGWATPVSSAGVTVQFTAGLWLEACVWLALALLLGTGLPAGTAATLAATLWLAATSGPMPEWALPGSRWPQLLGRLGQGLAPSTPSPAALGATCTWIALLLGLATVALERRPGRNVQ